MEKESFIIKPYARLITMLGDQLIKNELIALIELIKNSYDADASWVKVSFIDFNEDFTFKPTSKIIIEDDGCGMNKEILEKHWLNPATPEKLKRKNSRTLKGRILQGEKGIGRFAIFKLGKNIKITTRRQSKNANGDFIDAGENVENNLIYDFSKYDDDFLSENGKPKDLFLDDLEVVFFQTIPKKIVDKNMNLGPLTVTRKPFGTIIEISKLKSAWSIDKINKVQSEIGKLQPIFGSTNEKDFAIYLYKDNTSLGIQESYIEKLKKCLNDKAVFKIKDGKYISKNNEITFNLNGLNIKLNFSDPDINGIRLFKDKFNGQIDYKTECGNFSFEFYIFDFNADSDSQQKYYLDKDEKQTIKNHRIYLYRDGIRVLPYGDPEDDWLGIDMARGTIKADEFLSNDQVVGCIYISQKDNPNLVDKTNREGLIENGKALSDFITIIQLILKYLRKKPYAQYLIDQKKKKMIDDIKKGRPIELIESAKKQFSNDENILKFLNSFEKSYKKEKSIFEDRISKTENLAAVGLSIETASHDVMLFMKRTLELLNVLINDITKKGEINKEELSERLLTIKGSLSMVEKQLKDVQLLFPSTKNKTKNINVLEIIKKVENLYFRAFKDNNISVEFDVKGPPIIAKTTDAVLLQVFINLFDNSLYWLKTVNSKREIRIILDGMEQRIIFSDSGPGIKEDDVSYIFEAFYSGKGEDGRGLGLYIARQLLDRYDYSIELAEFSKDKILPGANFVLEFVKGE